MLYDQESTNGISKTYKSFCKAKENVIRTKQQPTDWKKIFTNPTTDTGFISKIYKEITKLDCWKTNNPIKKWGSASLLL